MNWLASFGMQVPNRHGNSASYRYGFNGKEKDDEVKGEGLQYDYGFRIYDPRIGKFLSQDPLSRSYPWFTPYQFASNSPIWAIDLDGLESKIVILSKNAPPLVFERTSNKRIEWQATKASYYKAFANHDGWGAGKKLYHSTTSNWSGPLNGTLTIDATGKTAKISFTAGKPLEIIKESLSMGWKATKTFNPIYPVPDKSIEGSGEYANTANNYKTLVLFPLAVESSVLEWGEMSTLKKIFNGISMGLDADEMAGGEKGSVIEQNLTGKGKQAFSAVKATVNLVGKTSALNELGNAEGGTEAVKATVEAVNGTLNTVSNASKINEKEE